MLTIFQIFCFNHLISSPINKFMPWHYFVQPTIRLLCVIKFYIKSSRFLTLEIHLSDFSTPRLLNYSLPENTPPPLCALFPQLSRAG